MKKCNLLIAILMFFLISCSENETIEFDCIETKLEQLEMVEFSGQDIGCKYFLELYNNNNKQYFLLGNHCADMISYPIDCNGNKLCKNGEDSKCRDFYKNANRIGIVGIEE